MTHKIIHQTKYLTYQQFNDDTKTGSRLWMTYNIKLSAITTLPTKIFNRYSKHVNYRLYFFTNNLIGMENIDQFKKDSHPYKFKERLIANGKIIQLTRI
jgi:predicted phosphoadenosine phosphosulfate sulfurtransferase